jgi:hypothetical protein
MVYVLVIVEVQELMVAVIVMNYVSNLEIVAMMHVLSVAIVVER